MNDICGITFKNDGKIYYFYKKELQVNLKDYVIVETEKGEQYGKVVEFKNSSDVNLSDIKDIKRKATKEDESVFLENKKSAKDAVVKCKQLVKELALDMTVIDASFTFDRKQLLISFYADERVDFRELAKRLANIYRTRIELRQVGARDKARQISGIGICGKELCCSSFLNHIDSVTMTMAKNQNIALNPNKINGVCGRLLCCLSYENEEYLRCQEKMPFVGSTVKTKYGTGKVISIDILNRKYKVEIENDIKEIELDDSEKGLK